MVMAPIDIRKPLPTRCPGHPPIGPGPLQPGGPFPLNPDVFDKFAFGRKDKNQDGQLSLDEWVKSDADVTMADIKQFERYDRDDDGAVSQAEYLQGRKWDRLVSGWFKKGFEGVKEGVKPLTQYLEGKQAAATEN